MKKNKYNRSSTIEDLPLLPPKYPIGCIGNFNKNFRRYSIYSFVFINGVKNNFDKLLTGVIATSDTLITSVIDTSD